MLRKLPTRFIMAPVPEFQLPACSPHILLVFMAFFQNQSMLPVYLIIASVHTETLKQAQGLKNSILCRQRYRFLARELSHFITTKNT